MFGRLVFVAAALLIEACASRAVTTTAELVSPQPKVTEQLLQSTMPAVDHHKHLMGPAIAEIAGGEPLLEPIALTPEFNRILVEREAAAKDAARLATLYAADAAVLTHRRHGWTTGAPKVADYLTKLFGRPYSLTPVHFSRQSNAAQIGGYYTRGAGAERQYIGYFHLALVRDLGGWKIASETPKIPVSSETSVKNARQLIDEMDTAGVRRAVVLSEGFWADSPLLGASDPYRRVMAENDWTASQVKQFPDRLIAFCSFNPVADHALSELDRCAANTVFRGLKFSFAMSGVDLNNPAHVSRLRSVFARANHHKFPIVVHVRGGPDYAADHVRRFVRDVLPAAPDVVVQIAHLWGGEAYSATALAAFAEELSAKREGTRNLYFDVSEIISSVAQTSSAATRREMAEAIRRIGVRRILFGSDGELPDRSWRMLVAFLPLTEDELRAIASNVAPYMDAGGSERAPGT